MTRHTCGPAAGTTLVETIVAVGLLGLLVAAVLPVTMLVLRADSEARIRAAAASAATSHLERLRALPWHAQPDGSVLVDGVSRISDQGFTADGQGLSDGGALDIEMPGYNDGPTPESVPAAGLVPLTRRWDVRTHPADPQCRVLRVEVAPTQALAAGRPMIDAAIARAQTVVCAAGARP